MTAQGVTLAIVAGLTVAIAAELVAVGLAVSTMQREGATLVLPPLPPIKLKPGGPGGPRLDLPAGSQSALDSMHVAAAIAGVVAVVVVLAVAA